MPLQPWSCKCRQSAVNAQHRCPPVHMNIQQTNKQSKQISHIKQEKADSLICLSGLDCCHYAISKIPALYEGTGRVMTYVVDAPLRPNKHTRDKQNKKQTKYAIQHRYTPGPGKLSPGIICASSRLGGSIDVCSGVCPRKKNFFGRASWKANIR